MKQLVIMPGGFHPFHAGHLALYQSALAAFPDADVKVAATNDTSARPFPFKLKEKLAQLAGVPPGDFYQVKSPFRADEITKSYNPADTQLIFVRSEKDADQPPRPGGILKNGSPAYLQPISQDMAPMTQHAYMAYLPTVEFGPGITSASEFRELWNNLTKVLVNPKSTPEQKEKAKELKKELVMNMYPATQKNPKLAANVVKLLDAGMGTEVVAEATEDLDKIKWVKPNFDFEWHEVEEQSKMKQVPVEVRQYYQKHFPNKEAWLKSVQNGKVVVVNPDHKVEIRNAPHDKGSLLQVLAPTGHEGPIGPAKKKRVNALFDKGGPIEMPIILKTNKGLWLIGGKTRLGTANYINGIPAKVWMIGGEQGVAEEVTRQMNIGGMTASYQSKYNQPISEDYLDETRS